MPGSLYATRLYESNGSIGWDVWRMRSRACRTIVVPYRLFYLDYKYLSMAIEL